MDILEGLCVCFMDWHEAFDRVYWTKLIHILNNTCTHWREGILISKLYMDHNVSHIADSVLRRPQYHTYYGRPRILRTLLCGLVIFQREHVC